MDICKLEFEGKSIPVTYNEEKVASRLTEAKYMLEKAANYFKENTPSQEVIDESIAEEVISSSYIEGYEVYFLESDLAKYGLSAKGKSKSEKAVVCGYRAYKHLLDNKNSVVTTKEELKSTWRELIKYKPYLTNFRIIGVKVGNRIQTVHVAPKAKYVRNMLDKMFTEVLPKYSGDVLLQSIIFHYLFTFIHPFIDGNGRTARLIEQNMILKHYNLDMCIPLSSAIIKDKRSYYMAFNSGQTFGNGHLDVLSIDITDFINNNCKFISQGIQKIMVENKYENDAQLPDALNFENREYKRYNREEVIDICGGIEAYCELILTARIREMDFGMSFSNYHGGRFFI